MLRPQQTVKSRNSSSCFSRRKVGTDPIAGKGTLSVEASRAGGCGLEALPVIEPGWNIVWETEGRRKVMRGSRGIRATETERGGERCGRDREKAREQNGRSLETVLQQL